jgi:hypothetical protein
MLKNLAKERDRKRIPMRRAKEEPKLQEVKFVLRKLQRLDPSAEKETGTASTPETLLKAGRTSSVKPIGKGRPGRPSVLYLSAATAIIVSAVILFSTGNGTLPGNWKIAGGKSEHPGLTREDPEENALLAEARQALSEGNTLGARGVLLRGEPKSHAKIAFMLAQSYDPNYLQTLGRTNGLSDKAEAKRWYEKWHELAVQSGLEMDSSRLQRIINAMR